MALKQASKELRADLEVVLAAVRQDGRALKHASPELQADREVSILVSSLVRYPRAGGKLYRGDGPSTLHSDSTLARFL